MASSPSIKKAASFGANLGQMADLGRIVRATQESIGGASGALVFATLGLLDRLEETLSVLALELGDTPVLLASGPGVMTQRTEIERSPALSGILFFGGNPRLVTAPPQSTGQQTGEALANAIDAELGPDDGTVCLFADSETFSPQVLEPLSGLAGRAMFFGGGGLSRGTWVLRNGKPEACAAAAMVLPRHTRPAVAVGAGVRLLGPFAPITSMLGSMVLRVGTEGALDVLTRASRGEAGRSAVMVAIAHGTAMNSATPSFVVRPIRGVDPSRGAVLLPDAPAPGSHLAFCLADAAATRQRLETAARDAGQKLSGACPTFGLLLSSASRSEVFFGGHDTQCRILRERFPGVPFAGLQTTFELGPGLPVPIVHLYSGIITVFGNPS